MHQNVVLCVNGLNLHHTILTFDDPERPFKNIVGKKETLVTTIFFFPYHVMTLPNTIFKFSVSVTFRFRKGRNNGEKENTGISILSFCHNVFKRPLSMGH